MDEPLEIVDVTDPATFSDLPPCADPRFDHRTCDYWEDGDRGSKAARASWLSSGPSRPAAPPPPRIPDNPFAPSPPAVEDVNPFAPPARHASSGPVDADDPAGPSAFNPFAPQERARPDEAAWPPKLRLLERGRSVFGSYAKVALLRSRPVAYAQFGPLSAYPRAQHIRELYPHLPQSPLPAVITCVATVADQRGRGRARALVSAVIEDLAVRGFSAIEAYPDLTLEEDEASAAYPGFWAECGFFEAAKDERFPVMRRELA